MRDFLEAETQTFEARLPEFLRDHAGEFVLIQGETVHGFFPDMETALAEGYRRLGGPPFLATRVEVEVPARFASNLIRPPAAR